MTVTIDSTQGLVRKRFASHDEAAKFANFYQTFEHHASVLGIDNDTLVLPLVKGRTMYEMLNDPSFLLTLMPTLAHSLSVNHVGCQVQEQNYRQICIERAHYPFVEDFTNSAYITGTIHGDLNLKNIIVTDNNEIVFIDRLERHGDILFDFSFIMSFMCKYIETSDEQYLRVINNFFRHYLPGKIDKEAFFLSLRNNFLNYGYYVARDIGAIAKFPEWENGKAVSRWLAKNDSFTDVYTNMPPKDT